MALFRCQGETSFCGEMPVELCGTGGTSYLHVYTNTIAQKNSPEGKKPFVAPPVVTEVF